MAEEHGSLLDLNDFDEEAYKKESEEIQKLYYLTKDNCTFARTKGGFVSLTCGEKTYERVNLYRTFPLTDPDKYISVREADEKAKEIGIIADLDDLDKEQAQMICEQLKLRYFTPIIEKIIDVKDEYGHAYFHVKTTYGVYRFTTHMGGDAVVSLSESRVMFTDLDGNRYEIPDIYTLTAAERKKLDLFI